MDKPREDAWANLFARAWCTANTGKLALTHATHHPSNQQCRSGSGAIVMGPIAALFTFTVRQTLLDRKIWFTLLVLAAPCALILLIRGVGEQVQGAEALWEMYHGTTQFLLIMVVLPLVCMVHGIALIGADVEGRTFVYLTTRRMRRGTVLLVKFVATALVLAVLCDSGMVCLHVSVFAGQDVQSLIAQSPRWTDWHPISDLQCYLLVIPAGVSGFLAIFSFIGLITARPLGLSVFYLIMVELVLANVPLKARVYSITHLLREPMVDAMPRLPRLFELPGDLRESIYTGSAAGLLGLLGVVVAALLLSGVLVTIRELIPAKVSRE